MRRWLVVSLFTIACGAHVNEVPNPTPVASHREVLVEDARAHTPEARDAELCGGPNDARDGNALEALHDAACSRFLPVLEAAVRRSCGEPFSEALRGIDHRRRWDGTYSHATRVRRNEAFATAALPIMRQACPDHFEEGNWLHPIAFVDEHWEDCASAPELRSEVVDAPQLAHWIGDAPAGAWLFAAALSRRVSPRGMRHVRKFLVCEMMERVAGFAREMGKGEVTRWMGPYLVGLPVSR